jgi:hypothetical protein
LPFRVKVMMALTKSLWPWKRVEAFREESDHDQIDLSQQPANRVRDFGDTTTDVKGAVGPEKVAATLLVDFNVDVLHAACSFGHVDVVLILRIRGDGKDLGWKLGGVAL